MGQISRLLEIESLADFDAHVVTARDLAGWFLQSVDLRERGAQLRALNPAGAVFLGCELDEATETSLRDRGALVFPRLPDLPFNPYRAQLYTAEELYRPADGGAAPAPDYRDSVDAAVYAWTRAHTHPAGLGDTLAMALHDHAITDALDSQEWHLDSTRVVGVMGGHAQSRGTDEFRAAAELGIALAGHGKLVLTGGGPGAMEAANLGARMARQPELLDHALERLAAVPDFTPSVGDWAAAALEVVETITDPTPTVGIPTWHYGHEPPNVFATIIAKYFTNALREDTLLQRCRGGIVYLPGAAGTVQEIFQAVTGNYYSADEKVICPMVLVGRDHWTRTLPAWQLLSELAAGRQMAEHIHLVETVAEAADLLM